MAAECTWAVAACIWALLWAAGTWAAYPFPTPVILYQPGQGSVRFDKAKASVYFQAVVERMADLVKGIIEKWDKAGLYQDVRSGALPPR